MSYIDGFVVPVPTDKREEYRAHCAEMAPLFQELGVTRMVECWGDDVPDGKVTDFRRAVAAEPDESVVFAWLVWPSKAVRDAGMETMTSDPRKQPDRMPKIFDMKRMIFGGFTPLFDTEG